MIDSITINYTVIMSLFIPESNAEKYTQTPYTKVRNQLIFGGKNGALSKGFPTYFCPHL